MNISLGHGRPGSLGNYACFMNISSGHRRFGSLGNYACFMNISSGHRRTGSFGNNAANILNPIQTAGQPPQFDSYILNHTTTAPGNLERSGTDAEQNVTAMRSTSWGGPGERMMPNNGCDLKQLILYNL